MKNNCPCGKNETYAACCEKYISGAEIPSTPEDLMRSRYTAYSKANIDYIQQTMKSPAADNYDPVEAKKWAQSTKWLGLKVLKSSQDNDHGLVEFAAFYSNHDKQNCIYEISLFERENGRWYYIDGKQPKIGRNDPCICGSEKKYKKCCG